MQNPLIGIQAAGGAVNHLFRGGMKNTDSIIPSLLDHLSGPPQRALQSLEGLRVIVSERPQTLHNIVPKLLHPPLSVNRLNALGALAEVAGRLLGLKV